jgi:threonine dehydrogenase-like Zn-dependent dehydrogenase
VGTLAAALAKLRGANHVILIDNVEYRLQNAKDKIEGIETINFGSTRDVVAALREKVGTMRWRCSCRLLTYPHAATTLHA